MSADHLGLRSQRVQALCRQMGQHDAQLLSDYAAVVCAVGDGTLDTSDLEAVMTSDGRREALSMLASLPSVRAAYTGSRLRLGHDDGSAGRFTFGM